jgi:ABC-type branched-subunit amino acid transport system permease subunit
VIIGDLQFWIFVGALAGIYAIFALGLQIQFGYAGLLNFGHVGFMAIGAYSMAILTVKTGLPLWLSCVAAVAISMAFGVALAFPTLRLRADYLAITTIAFSEIIRYVAINDEGLTGGSQGTIHLSGTGASYNTDWVAFQSKLSDFFASIVGTETASKDFVMLVVAWTCALVFIVLMQIAIRSPWGRALRAVREDEDAAAALGKNVFFLKLQALMLGAALAAFAGLLYAFQVAFFSPEDFEPLTTMFAYLVVILGGTARAWGTALGALVFAAIFAGTRFLDIAPLTSLSAADRAYLRLVIVGLILIGLMVFRPQGFLGKKEEMLFG